MDGLEIPAMVAALLAISGVVFAKVATTQLIGRMNRQINRAAQVKQETLGRLKSAQSQKLMYERNKTILEKAQSKLSKRIGRVRKEIADFEEEAEARRKRSDAGKVD
ncbi:MAG: hypothetical protein VX733_07260 [Candidatus Latescibacterota bacterium]|nr:hypothetical protein [Candidatus Latescibacterota bacterium]